MAGRVVYSDPALYLAPGAPLPLAGFSIVDTGDPAKAHAQAVSLFAPHRMETVRGDRPFRAVLNHARLNSLSLYYIRYEPEVIISSGPPKNYYLVLLPLAGECHVRQHERAVPVMPGSVFVVNPDAPLVMHWLDNCALLVAKVDIAQLAQVVEGHLGHPPAEPVIFHADPPVKLETCATLVQLMDLILADLENPKSTVGARAGEQPAELLFANMLLRQIPNSFGALLDRPASRAAPYYVKRAEEFVRLHAREKIRIKDMVAVTGVSARTLFKGFKRFRGMGPITYVKLVRLERAHSELKSSDDRRGVAEIARAWGFTHAGNFARDYRARFGERPSDTRRRARV